MRIYVLRKETLSNRKKIKELEVLREQIGDLTTTNAELTDKVEKFDKEIKHTKVQTKKLEEERNHLESAIQSKVSRFLLVMLLGK